LRSTIAVIVLAAAMSCAPAAARAAQGKKATIDIQSQSTFAAGADEKGKPGGVPLTNGDTRVPFKLTVPLGDKLTFTFAHTNIDETLGRVTDAHGTYVYPGAYHGDANDASVAYSSGAVTWSAGYLQRHRACCPYDQIEEHLAYVGIEDDFGPVTGKKSLFVFKLLGMRSVNHKQSAAFLSANAPGYTYADYKGNLPIYRTSIEMRAPIGSSGLRLLAEAGVDSDYFDYQPIPLYYPYVNVGLEKTFSPNLRYTMLFENLTQHEQGYPFASPNAIHRAKIVLTADVTIPF
jgi:hypothetical protein